MFKSSTGHHSTIWGYGNEPQFHVNLRPHHIPDQIFVSVSNLDGKLIGCVTLTIHPEPKPRSGLTFTAETVNQGLDQIQEFFAPTFSGTMNVIG